LALSITNNAINYLKQQFLPYIYGKIENIHIDDKSFSEYGLHLNASNINVEIPKPDNDVINHWVPSMISATNSVKVQNKKQDLTIEFDFNGKFTIVPLIKGHFKATIEDIDLVLDI
jgi:hypothetical protein